MVYATTVCTRPHAAMLPGAVTGREEDDDAATILPGAVTGREDAAAAIQLERLTHRLSPLVELVARVPLASLLLRLVPASIPVPVPALAPSPVPLRRRVLDLSFDFDSIRI